MNRTDSERNTILAALRHYQHTGMTDRSLRPDWLEEIATDGGTAAGLDAGQIDQLCERLDAGEDSPRPHRPLPMSEGERVLCPHCGGENLHYVESIGCGREVLQFDRERNRLVVEGLYSTRGYDEGATDQHLFCRDRTLEMRCPPDDEIEFV